MKKGFVFTLGFSLFFLTLLYIASAYLNMLQMREAALDSGAAWREAYIADDIAYDYLSLWGMKVSIEKAPAYAYWTVEETLGVQANGGQISSYEGFISGEYSDLNNIDVEVELDREGRILLEPIGATYRHSGNGVSVEGKAEEYRISAKLGNSCGACSSSGAWRWASAGDGPYVVLDIMDSNGTRVSPGGAASGYVRGNETNSIYLVTENSGFFSITLSGGNLRLESNVDVEAKTSLGFPAGSEMKAYVPARLKIGDRSMERVPIVEK